MSNPAEALEAVNKFNNSLLFDKPLHARLLHPEDNKVFNSEGAITEPANTVTLTNVNKATSSAPASNHLDPDDLRITLQKKILQLGRNLAMHYHS